jgi:YggT family protein
MPEGDFMMDDNQEVNDVAVDLREETLVTRQPGYTATEQVVRDVAAERRMRVFQLNRIIWSMLAFLEILLALRFLLRLIAANADSGFAMFMYGITGVLAAPFNGLVGTPTSGGSALEVTTLIAMGVYALVFWGIAYVFRMVVDRPSARSFTRTTREQTPGGDGNVRTTHTTISDNNKM